MDSGRLTTFVHAALLALVLSGAWVSGRLVAADDGGWQIGARDAAAVTSPCGLSWLPSARCADVVDSRWGSFDVYIGQRRVYVPASLIGLAYFVFLGVWLVMAPPDEGVSRWVSAGWRVATLVGLAASVFYMGVMLLTLGQWCSACLAIHAINALMFVGVWWSLPRAAGSQGSDQNESSARPSVVRAFIVFMCRCLDTRTGIETGKIARAEARGSEHKNGECSNSMRRRVIGSACLMSVCAVAGVWWYFDALSTAKHQWRKAGAFKQAYESLRENADLVLREFYAQPVVSAGLMTASIDEAPTDAPRIQLFTDCDSTASVCFDRSWHDELLPAIGRPTPVERHYLPHHDAEGPVALDMNESMQAARAAEAARIQGGDAAYARMKRLLFAHRRDKGGRQYEALARRAGLDPERLLRDMYSDPVQHRIERDLELAGAMGVTSTPAVFVDGRRVPPLCLNSRAFWSAIVAETSRSTFNQRVSQAGSER